MMEPEQGAPKLPVSRGCRQRAAQPPQHPLMDELFLRDARERTTSRVIERRPPKTCEGERCRFLAAGEDLQELGERLGLRISEPEGSRRWRGRSCVGKPKAELAVDHSNHGGLAAADMTAQDGVSPQLPQAWGLTASSGRLARCRRTC